uniref:Uncharacterized protein n=1 Tax=Triticum urartu TaxID=4572 RepID=A0A8R7R5K3_TRIUA
MSCKQRKTQTNESTPHVYFHTQIAFFANLSSSKCIHGDLYGFLLLCTCIGFRAPSVVAPASSPLILTIAIPEVPPRRLAQATRGRLGFPPSAATLVCLPSSPSPVASGRPAAAAGPLPPPPPSIPALVPLPARRLSSSGGLLPLGAVRSGSCCCSAWRGSVWDGASEWCSLRWLERPASRELLASSEMGERGPLDLGRRPFRRDSIGLTGARWCWPFFFGHGGGGGGCGAGVSVAPDPDLKASVYFNHGCLRWSCFGRPLSPELYLYGGWRWEVAPEKSEASSAGHDGGDAQGHRTLLVGDVQVSSFPSSFHPARMPGESPNPCRIERQRCSGRRHPLEGVV